MGEKIMRFADRIRRRGFRRNEQGATAVEFAMIAPLFFLMLGVVLETGLMLFTEYTLQTSVQEAARIVRTGQAQEGQMNVGQFKSELCKLAGKLIDCNGKVTVYMKADNNFTSLSTTVPSYLSIGPNADGSTNPTVFQCGAPSQPIALIATYDWDFSLPYFMSFLGNRNSGQTRRLAAFAMFRNEPFPTVSGNTCT
jgi:Flp pilus assembly protein TadG